MAWWREAELEPQQRLQVWGRGHCGRKSTWWLRRGMLPARRETGVTVRPTLPCHCPLTHAANWPTSTELPPALLSTAPGLQEQKSCSEIQWRPDSSLERMLDLSLNTQPNRKSILNLSNKQDTRDENSFMFCIKPPPKTSKDRAVCEDSMSP